MKHKKLDLVILAGGRGSRIKKITNKIPKPMIRFGDVPFLKFLINYYAKFNFEKIYILGGYKNEIIKKYFKKIARVNSVEIKVLDEPKPLGTGGALNILKKRSINDFFLINGDSYFEISNKEFLKMQATNKIGSLLLIKNENYKSNKKLANLKVNKGKISKKGNLMNSGIYFFKKKILKQIPLKPFSLENDFLEGKIIYNKINLLINKKKKFFIDIGTYKNYFGAKKNLKNKLIQPAIFFDRDGVINKLKPYVGNMKRFELNIV